jgi:hypothetical protein
LGAFFAAVYSSPEGVGELIFGDGLEDLIPAHLKAVLGEQEASKL